MAVFLWGCSDERGGEGRGGARLSEGLLARWGCVAMAGLASQARFSGAGAVREVDAEHRDEALLWCPEAGGKLKAQL